MKNYLGIELGSTRIKAVMINNDYRPVYSSDFIWKSTFKNGIWTYDLNQLWDGIRSVLKDVDDPLSIDAAGISGMMHGYLAFDQDWNLLTPFRTWQNNITKQAAAELTELFQFNIPQRWSIAHLYQAILNKEPHIKKIAHITTLAGYVHYMLTGINAVGIGEASGIFPIDSKTLDYNKTMLLKLESKLSCFGIDWKLEELLPQVLIAGNPAGGLTSQGANRLNGLLPVGLPFAPPEGDAGTGMVATNCISEGTGNVSAGTSVFSMIVLEKPIKKVYPEIDLVTTPCGKPVAMVHCNNCSNDANAWISVLKEVAELFDASPKTDTLYERLFKKSLEGADDCGGVLVCNYMAGEELTKIHSGFPLVLRKIDREFTLANFMKATLYSTMATLKMGMDLLKKEEIKITSLIAHGGLFKTPNVCQQYLAAACKVPVTCMETAGEGGAFGMALLAAFLLHPKDDLSAFLDQFIFKTASQRTVEPNPELVAGFNRYMKEYENLLRVEQTANSVFNDEQ